MTSFETHSTFALLASLLLGLPSCAASQEADEQEEEETATSEQAVAAPSCVRITSDRVSVEPGLNGMEYIHYETWVKNTCRTTQSVRLDLRLYPDTDCKRIAPGGSRMFFWDVSSALIGAGSVRGIKKC